MASTPEGEALIEIKAYTPGIYARSEALVQATRDFDRGRATAEALKARQEADLHEFLEVRAGPVWTTSRTVC